MEEDRQRFYEHQQQWFQWMATLGQAVGAASPPPMPAFAPPQPNTTPSSTPMSMDILLYVLFILAHSLHNNQTQFCRIHRQDRLPSLNGLRGMKILTLVGVGLDVCRESCVSALSILLFVFRVFLNRMRCPDDDICLCDLRLVFLNLR